MVHTLRELIFADFLYFHANFFREKLKKKTICENNFREINKIS